MWAAIRLFFANNWLAIAAKAAIVFGFLGAVLSVYRAGAKSEENKNIKEELRNAKENLAQDGIVAGNDDVDGMRTKLSEALRRKRNS